MGTLLFERHPSPVIIYDRETLTILKANKAFHEKYEYTAEDISRGTLTIEHIRPKSELPKLRKAVKKWRDKGVKTEKIFLHLSKTGEKFYVQVSSEEYEYKGKAACIVVFQDLTKRIEAEKKSLQAYEELQQHIANSPLASVKLDHNFRIREWSKRAEEISEYGRDEVLGKTLHGTLFYKKEYQGEIKQKIDQLRAGHRKRDIIESEIITKSGNSVAIRIHVSVQRKKNGKIKSVLAFIENLTQQERIEIYYKRLFEFARDGVYLLTKNGRLVDCNQRAADQLQLPAEDLMGKQVARLAPQYQPDGTLSSAKAAAMTKKAQKEGYSLFEWTARRPDGQFIEVEISLSSILFPDGEFLHAIVREIGDKKQIQNKLKRSEELFRNLFLCSPAALVMVDPHENVKAVNESFVEMFGYTFEEVSGKNIDNLIVPPELFEQAPKVSEGSYMEDEFQFETVRLTKSGERKHVIAAGRPVFVDERPVAGFGMYIDITDRKIYEDELNRSIEEKQVMLEEIHHRVKNNLAVISGILQLQAFDAADETARKALNDSQLRIKSMSLIHEMLYKTENFTNISVRSYLDQLLEHIKRSLTIDSKEIEVDIEAGDVAMTMKQAVPTALLINELITNAYKHAFTDANKGKISITVSQSEDNICLRVADNGKGLGKNFKLEGNKSLGLNLVKTLAGQLGARISYGSNNGTEFEFCIPKE